MADFKFAYVLLKDFEGGYDNDPDDRGGETYAGIARNFFPDWPGWAIIDQYKKLLGSAKPSCGDSPANLTKALAAVPTLQKQVEEWYRKEWWDKCGLASLPQILANEIFEQMVNLGKSGSGKKLQLVCNAWNYDRNGEPLFVDLEVDGLIGPKTLSALAILLKRKASDRDLVHCLNCMQGSHYIELAAKKKSQRKYIKGWLNRTFCFEKAEEKHGRG